MSDTIYSVSNENDKRGVHKKVIKYFIVKMFDDLTSLVLRTLYLVHSGVGGWHIADTVQRSTSRWTFQIVMSKWLDQSLHSVDKVNVIDAGSLRWSNK